VPKVLKLPLRLSLGVEETFLHRSPHLGVGLSYILTLIPLWDGVVLWEVDINLLACHFLLPHSHYLVGSRVIHFPCLECRHGTTPYMPNEIVCKVHTLCKGFPRGETPFSVRNTQCKGFSLRKGCQQGTNFLFLMGMGWVEVFLHIIRVIKVLLKTLAHTQFLIGKMVPTMIHIILFQRVLNLGAPTWLVGILGLRRGYLFWQL
jgi:hypothetical protein